MTDLAEQPARADRARDNFALLGSWMDTGVRMGVPAVIAEIHAERQWEVLGFDSFDAACQSLYGGWKPALSRAQRVELVEDLTKQGLSTRAIASIAGVSHETARQDQDSGVKKLTPGPSPLPSPVIGLDGKTYRRPTPEEQQAAEQRRRAEREREEIEHGWRSTNTHVAESIRILATQGEHLVSFSRDFWPHHDTYVLHGMRITRARLDHVQRLIDWLRKELPDGR
jgi:hypothetical protein